MVERQSVAGVRVRLLLSACAVIVPAIAQAQDNRTFNGARTTPVVIDGTDTVTVTAGGSIVNSSTGAAQALQRAINFGTGADTGNTTVSQPPSPTAGPTINNSGLIQSINAPTGRAIDSSGDFTNRPITIINNASGVIQGNSDAIRIANTTTTAPGSIININNSGTIESLNNPGATVNTNLQPGNSNAGSGILTEVLSGVTINVTNNAGGVIRGSRGIVTGATSNIVNNGTITGNSRTGSATTFSSGEALRLGGGDAATNNATVTLGVGSLTQTTDAANQPNPNGQAIVFGGLGTHIINVNAGATIIGSLLGSGVAGIDIINLTTAAGGPTTGTLAQNANFESLNVQAGTWAANTVSTFATGTTVDAGASLRFDTGGVVRGAIANNGELVFNRADELLQNDPAITVAPSLSGTGNLRLSNTGTFALTAGANTYSGATFLDTGRLRADGLNAFSPNSALVIGTNGTADLNGFDQTVTNLSGAGSVSTGTAIGGILTTGSAGGDTTFSGAVSGLGGLTKVGTGALTLSGANTSTGLLRVSGGTIALNGSYAGSGQVDTGATLAGTGTLSGLLTVADGGIVAPGNSGIGRLTLGGLVLSGGSLLNFDFGAPGTSDTVAVNGNLTLDGTLNANNVGGFGQGVYRLIDYTGTLTDNGVDLGTLPANTDRSQVSVQTSIGQQVNLIYGNASGGPVQFWDGPNVVANGLIDGGTGSWTNAGMNWTTADGAVNQPWQSGFAVFQTAGGTVTVNDAIAFTGMQFTVNGYTIVAGTGTLQATAVQTNLRVDPGITASIIAPIGGAGGLLKNDAGTLILGGVNSYGGGTTIAGGTLRATVAGALPGTSDVSLQTGTTLDIAADQTVASIAGTGAITLSGGSLTTGGTNATSTFGGVLSGSGGLTKTGTGMLTLLGANSYTGPTTVSGGVLTAGASGSFGSGSLAVANGATADFASFQQSVGALSGGGTIALGANGGLTTTSAANSTFGGQLTGAAATFTKAGTGTLTLSGTGTTFSGGTTINGGRLVIANAGALANTLAVTVNGAGTLEITTDKQLGSVQGAGALALTAARLTLTGTGDTTFTGAASGTGGITQAGAGTLTLSGANTFTGDTVAAAATISVTGRVAGNAGASGGARFGGTGTVAGTLTIADGGTLSPGTTGIGTLTVGGLVLNNNSNLAYDLGAPGTGDRVQVNGNLVLDGRLNVTDAGGFGQGVYRLIDYTGTLTDNILEVASVPAGTALAQTQIQTSAANQVNLVVSQQLPDIQFWDGANTTANGRVDGGSGSWNNRTPNWTNAAGDTNFRWGSRFAVLQGAAGTVTVDDAITFTGMQFMTNGYTIAAGTGSLSTAQGAAALRVDPNVTATIGASIGGTGGIAKLDGGTLILSGVNGYAGATAVNGGTLRVTTTGALPTGTTVTIATGATLDLGASQSVANLAGNGAVTLTGGSLTTGGAGTATTYAGIISGAGGLTKVGAGTFTLTGANSYTGATSVNTGTLALGAGGSLGSGNLTLAAGTTVNLAGNSTTVGAVAGSGSISLGSGTLTSNAAANTSYTGVISGSGGFVKSGTGTLTLTGANTYTGTTSVRGGTLTLANATALPNTAAVQVDSGAILGLSTNKTLATLGGAGTVTLASGTTLTLGAGDFSGAITGASGNLVKNGTGTLTLGGVNTFGGTTAGSTNVTAGQLIVNGSLTSPLTVGAAGRLGGSGQVGSLTINGTLAPGNSIGTLTSGTVTFNAGSIFQVETNATGQADLLAASGTATINGGTVQVLSGGGNYPLASAFPILTASAVNGTFTGITSDFAFLTPSLRYAPTVVTLVLVRNDQTFASIGQSDNQRAVAGVIQQLGSGPLYDAIVLANTPTARTAFDLLSGEIHADMLTVANRGVQGGRNAMLDRLAVAPAEDGIALWLDVDAAHRDVEGQDGFGSLDWDRSAYAGGVEAGLGVTRIGVGYRYSDDAVALDARSSRGKVKTDAVLAYAGANFGGLHLAGGATYSWHNVTTDRVIGVSTLRALETAREKGRTYQAFAQAAFDVGRGDYRWGPYAGISAASTTLRGGAEQGTPATALTLGRPRLTTTLADYGLQASGPLLRFGERSISVSAQLGGRSYLDDNATLRTVRFTSGGQAFNVAGADFGETAITTRVAISASALGGNVSLGFNGERSGEYRSYGGRLAAGWRF